MTESLQTSVLRDILATLDSGQDVPDLLNQVRELAEHGIDIEEGEHEKASFVLARDLLIHEYELSGGEAAGQLDEARTGGWAVHGTPLGRDVAVQFARRRFRVFGEAVLR